MRRRFVTAASRQAVIGRSVTIGAAVLGLVAMVACAGEATESGGDEDLFDTAPAAELDLELRDTEFDLTDLTISAGQVVAITIENTGAAVHDFTLDAPRTRSAFRLLDGETIPQDAPRRSTAHVTVRPGSSTELRLEVSEPGEYEFYCSVPGHRSSGMRGTLAVVAG